MRNSIAADLLAALNAGRSVVVVRGVPERGIKTLSILCAFTVLCHPKAWGEIDPQNAESRAVEPAYRFVEAVSDGIFDFARLHVVGALLPGRLTRSLKAAPRKDSTPLFERNLHDKETRYLARARAAYPMTGEGARSASPESLRAWRFWAAGEQVSVAVDALGDTLTERYQLEFFGRSSGDYAKDKRNWDPGFLSMAGLLGGAFVYLNGMHAAATVGRLKFAVDLPSGVRFQRALQGGGNSRSLAGFELGLKDTPLTLSTEWALADGRLRSERVGLNYILRY